MAVIDSTTGLPIPKKGAAQTDTDGDALYTIFYGDGEPVFVTQNREIGCVIVDGGSAYSHTDTSNYQTPQMLLDGGNSLNCTT
jgi:hypothetical protein